MLACRIVLLFTIISVYAIYGKELRRDATLLDEN